MNRKNTSHRNAKSRRNKTLNKIISIFLVLIMMTTVFPVKTYAMGEEISSETPVETQETPVEEIVIEEPQELMEEPAVEEPQEVVEEPAVEEPQEVVEEPAAEEPQELIEEPAVEEPQELVEEPAVEEPQEVVEEPAVEESQELAEEQSEDMLQTEEILMDEPSERVCEEGCILEGEEEHLENDGECFVWLSCDLTEGCEGPFGHEGECYGAGLYAVNAAITVSSSSYRNKYVVISDGSSSGLYYINNNGVIQNADGTDVQFEPGSYTIYYGGRGSGMMSQNSFASASVTVSGNQNSVTVSRMNSANINNSSYEMKYLYATSAFYNASTFDHIDIRVQGSYEIPLGNQSYAATISNPTVVVKVGGTQVASQTWNSNESYEWRKTGLSLNKSSGITVELTFDLTYTDSSQKKHVLEDVHITYDSVNDREKFIDAIAICDIVQGLDFRVSVEDIAKEIQYHTVTYVWKVYDTNGGYISLPSGAPSVPVATSGHEEETDYVYDTEYVSGTAFYDYENGKMYTFHGWDTYSHSSTYNPIPSNGYTALDDGDKNAANNPKIKITADTYIYGYWTVTNLEPASAHIAIEKVFVIDGQNVSLKAAENLWFSVETGVDHDSDGETMVDVNYQMLSTAVNGEYKIPVYQYDTPFVFTELNADVAGYTRTTTVTVNGNHIASYVHNGDQVTVAMNPVYQGENVHLGTVTYTNIYTKNVGTPQKVYPSLTLLKTAADTYQAQDGVEFTLYRDEACTNALKTWTTSNGGLATLKFDDLSAGTYYLKETASLDGYHLDSHVYVIVVSETHTVEELHDETYVSVTYYDLSVTVPSDSTASYSDTDGDRLHVFNEPVLGTLTVKKTFTGIDQDQDKVNAVVIVHGPVTRNNNQEITDLGSTRQLTLNKENSWQMSLEDLAVGEYLIHESFASVDGYTWTNVTYKGLETISYNNITSGVFEIKDETVVEVILENEYVVWESADFYIRKVDENDQPLAGAQFSLYLDEACTIPFADSEATVSAATKADGYAHFTGYKVPSGHESVTYYLKETRAPEGYYLSDQVFKVVISAVTANNVTTYAPMITLAKGRALGYDIDTDLLIVVNYPVTGSLSITKSFTDGVVPAALNEVSVQVGGPSGYLNVVKLNNENGWSVRLDNLVLGEYTISELNADVPGYTWSVAYTSNKVTLSETNPGTTAYGTEIFKTTTITNTYTRNNEYYDVPATLTVKKVGENNEVLAGAVFTLERYDETGTNVIHTVSFTTGEDGLVVFDLLTGFADETTSRTGTYVLSETKAPEGYEATNTTWTIEISEDDGQLRVELNENKNIFENFWDWVVGNVSSNSWENGVLTVSNAKKLGALTIRKVVEVTDGYEAQVDAATEYTFTVDFSDDTFDQTFILRDGEEKTIENIPWGTTYTVIEETADAVYVSHVDDEQGKGKIWLDETIVTATNTYTFTTCNEGLNLLKVDADDQSKVVEGAGFTLYTDAELTVVYGNEVFSNAQGEVHLPILEAGTYYLVETTTPQGYYSNNGAVYLVTAEETAVVKNAGTADVLTELQMSVQVENLTGTTGNPLDEVYLVENTAIKQVIVTVEKIWDDNGRSTRPEEVIVTLYRDGEVFESVTLNKTNQWTYVWDDLTDEYTWTVDELMVPDGYEKIVENNENNWTITNSYIPEIVPYNDTTEIPAETPQFKAPNTSDDLNAVVWGMLNVTSILCFFFLILMKKKKEEL